MHNVLLVAEPNHPARLRSAVAAAVRLAREEPVTLHLLRVEPRVSGHVAMFFGERELLQLQLQGGREALHPAETLLAAAGVPFTSLVRVGRSAETIAQVARELRCDRVILGEGEGLAARVFGSVAAQVRHLLGTAGETQVIGS